MSRIVKVCAIQGGPCGMDREDNIQKHLKYLDRAMAEQSADIVCFSEYSTIPAFCGSQIPDNFRFAEPIPDGPASKAFSAAAKQYGIYIIVDIFEDRGNGLFYNSAPMFGPDGKLVWGTLGDGTLVQNYQKIHIPSSMDADGTLRANEKTYFHPGAGPAIFATSFGKVAILICWDKRFTELWKIYALRGAEIVFNPMATWGAWRGETYFDEMRIMALYNQYFVVGVGKSGVETVFGEKECSGGSVIADPQGAILSCAQAEPGKAIFAEVDLDTVKRSRIMTPIMRDRRPELYSSISDVSDGLCPGGSEP